MTNLRHGDKTKIEKMAKDMKELADQHGDVTKDDMLRRGHSETDLSRLGSMARDQMAAQ